MRKHLQRKTIRNARRGYGSLTTAHGLHVRPVKEEADRKLCESSEDMAKKETNARLLDKNYEGSQKAVHVANFAREGEEQKLQLGQKMDFGRDTASASIRGFNQLSIAGDRHLAKLEERSNSRLRKNAKKGEQAACVKEKEKSVSIKEEETNDTRFGERGVNDNVQPDRRELMQSGPHRDSKRYIDNQIKIWAANRASLEEARKTARIAE